MGDEAKEAAPQKKKRENLMSFLQTNDKPEDDKKKPTAPPSITAAKHDEFKDYDGVRRGPQEAKSKDAPVNKQDVMHIDEEKEKAELKEKERKGDEEKRREGEKTSPSSKDHQGQAESGNGEATISDPSLLLLKEA